MVTSWKENISRWAFFYAIFSASWLTIPVLQRLGSPPLLDNLTATRATLYGLLILLVFFLLFTRSFLKSKGPSIVWWGLGSIWLGGFFVTNVHILPQLEPFGQIPELAVLGSGWLLFILSSAIRTIQSLRQMEYPLFQKRSRLWLVGLIFTAAGTGWLILTAILAGKTNTPYPPPAYAIVMAGSIAALYTVLIQVLSHPSYDLQQLIREYSLSISSVPDVEHLAIIAIRVIDEAIGIQRGYLFLVETDKNGEGYSCFRLHAVPATGEPLPPAGLIRAENPFADDLNKKHTPITLHEVKFLPRYQKRFEEDRDWLISLGIEVFVPINTKDQWIGLLGIGPRGSKADYTEEDFDLFVLLADQTAVALQNTRLVESLTRVNNEFRRAYTALERANRQLERIDQTKSDFINIASHELRSPLTLIRGYSEILHDEPSIQDNSYYSKMVSGIHDGILRLNEVVDSMLDMASIDARSLELHTEEVTLNVLLRLVVEGHKTAISERNLNVVVADLRSLPVIQADNNMLRKAFSHVISNAIKYTPDGGSIRIFGQKLPPDPDKLPEGGVEIVISDTGIGIDPEYQELIFNKFYQTNKASLHSSGKTKFKGGGPGLGLSITKGIIEAHAGKVWVESPGYNEKTLPGSQFHILLPLKR